jgi:hypothetical protein
LKLISYVVLFFISLSWRVWALSRFRNIVACDTNPRRIWGFRKSWMSFRVCMCGRTHWIISARLCSHSLISHITCKFFLINWSLIPHHFNRPPLFRLESSLIFDSGTHLWKFSPISKCITSQSQTYGTPKSSTCSNNSFGQT